MTTLSRRMDKRIFHRRRPQCKLWVCGLDYFPKSLLRLGRCYHFENNYCNPVAADDCYSCSVMISYSDFVAVVDSGNESVIIVFEDGVLSRPCFVTGLSLFLKLR